MLRVQVNRGLDGKFQKLENLLENFQQEYVFGMATEIATRSPVDTGTYMKAHRVGTSAVAQTIPTSGEKRPFGDGPFGSKQDSMVQPTVDRLVGAAPMDTTRLVFSNAALHATDVEFKHGYGVFQESAREHRNVAKAAADRARARNR